MYVSNSKYFGTNDEHQVLQLLKEKVKKPIFDVDYSDFFHVKDNFEFYFKDDE